MVIQGSLLELSLGIFFSTVVWLVGAEIWKRFFPRDTTQEDFVVSGLLEGLVAKLCERVRKEHNVNIRVEDFKNQFSKEEFEEFGTQLFKADRQKMNVLVKEIADANREEFGAENSVRG